MPNEKGPLVRTRRIQKNYIFKVSLKLIEFMGVARIHLDHDRFDVLL